MEVLTFKVLPEFLTATLTKVSGLRTTNKTDPPPKDPFASDKDGVPHAPQLGGRICSPAEILKIAAGIPFPEGATSIYNAANSKIVVMNTPENLNAIRDYLEWLETTSQPRNLVFTQRIIQADGPTLRKLAQESAGKD